MLKGRAKKQNNARGQKVPRWGDRAQGVLSARRPREKEQIGRCYRGGQENNVFILFPSMK